MNPTIEQIYSDNYYPVKNTKGNTLFINYWGFAMSHCEAKFLIRALEKYIKITDPQKIIENNSSITEEAILSGKKSTKLLPQKKIYQEI